MVRDVGPVLRELHFTFLEEFVTELVLYQADEFFLGEESGELGVVSEHEGKYAGHLVRGGHKFELRRDG